MQNTEKLIGADRAWGFRIGVDGMIDVNEAMRMMSIGKNKLYQLMNEGKIRRAKMERKTVICRRSVLEYLGSIEV